MTDKAIQISVSIVSHNHAPLVIQLLQDLRSCSAPGIEVLITLNTAEAFPLDPGQYPFPVTIIRNEVKKGFGANHNAAFNMARGEYFCVLNPDIRFAANPFPGLLRLFDNPKVAIVAPRVVNPEGLTEDSARPFPRPTCILRKALGHPECARYPDNGIPSDPDWVAGMFMLIRSSVFRALNGFSSRYYMYYEDVDLCARARLMGWDIGYQPDANVIHDARRDSHKKLKFMMWHLTSMLRFMASGVARRAMRMRRHENKMS